MAEERVQRRLAAILAADVVGYSRLMEQDEAGTLAVLKARRKNILEPVVTRHRGRIFKVAGDGALVEFGSAVDAVECAVELQHGMADANAGLPDGRRIVVRIGVNLGDVMVEGSDLYGDAVNISARLEGIAEPGGVLISGTAFEYVRNKVNAAFEDLGTQTLKNIAWPVRVYRVRLGGEAAMAPPALALPDRPSIAVLPFENMSGDPEQEYFADGMVEEIITALSRMHWLFVIARNSSFAYKGRTVDVKQVGRELGVRYVLEGSVRRAGNRVRITGQLIDTSTGAHLWADRFDGGLDDIFDLQDRVTASVVGAIGPKLEEAEIARAQRKPTENLDAYDYFMRGMAGVYQWTREATTAALSDFGRAIELDPNFASAYGLAAYCYTQRKIGGWFTDREKEVGETARLARKAVLLGRDDALALCTAGVALAYTVGDIDDGAAFIDRALVLNPNLAWAWLYGGWAKIYLGEPEAAIERGARAMRLSPRDPQLFMMHTVTAAAHYFAGRYPEAASWAEEALRENPDNLGALRYLAASCAMIGRQEQAQKAMARLRELDPMVRLSNLKNLITFRRREDFAKWSEGLRKAGLPE
jgi:TolB-like protein